MLFCLYFIESGTFFMIFFPSSCIDISIIFSYLKLKRANFLVFNQWNTFNRIYFDQNCFNKEKKWLRAKKVDIMFPYGSKKISSVYCSKQFSIYREKITLMSTCKLSIEMYAVLFKPLEWMTLQKYYAKDNYLLQLRHYAQNITPSLFVWFFAFKSTFDRF